MSRRGFSLLEMVVTLVVALVIFAAALMIYNFSNRSRGVTATARALQTAMLIQESLTADLGRLVQAGASPLSVPPDDPARLSFYACEPAAGAALNVRGVVYRLAHAPGPLTRECSGAPVAVGTAPLTALVFTPFQCATGPYLRVTMTVGREPGEPPGPPTVHSFLAPVNVTPPVPGLTWKVEGPFRDSADEPGPRDLPQL